MIKALREVYQVVEDSLKILLTIIVIVIGLFFLLAVIGDRIMLMRMEQQITSFNNNTRKLLNDHEDQMEDIDSRLQRLEQSLSSGKPKSQDDNWELNQFKEIRSRLNDLEHWRIEEIGKR
jgi:predicted PurR-regulated permease PerM